MRAIAHLLEVVKEEIIDGDDVLGGHLKLSPGTAQHRRGLQLKLIELPGEEDIGLRVCHLSKALLPQGQPPHVDLKQVLAVLQSHCLLQVLFIRQLRA